MYYHFFFFASQLVTFSTLPLIQTLDIWMKNDDSFYLADARFNVSENGQLYAADYFTHQINFSALTSECK